MSEPSSARPVPGPPRPGAASTDGPAPLNPDADPASPVDGAAAPAEEPQATGEERSGAAPFEDLADRPVAEHVGVFEAEHARLQRELGTIDQL